MPTYRLIKVYDLREWDEGAECYMPIDDDSKSRCNKCGRLHAKVYLVLRVEDVNEFCLGGGCVRKYLDGWEPEKEEVKRLEKESAKEAKDKGRQKLVDLAMPIVQEVAALEVPEIVYLGTKYTFNVPVYGMAGSSVQVCCREGLTEERRRCCVHSWKSDQVDMRLFELFPRTSELLGEDKNHKRRRKLELIIREKLGIW